jgi:transcription-repair coupling factor (superfamily II helicase)
VPATHSVLSPPALPPAGQRLRWSGLYGAARALAIAQAARQHPGLSVVVVPDSPSADQLGNQLRFFLGANEAIPILHFPDWETLPYDQFSPHQDIISERLETLYRLPLTQRGILLVPIPTLLTLVPPRQFVEAHSVMMSTGERLDVVAFRRRLEEAGYRNVGQVLEHGEFAVRGSLLDLFPMGSVAPYRVDLFDDEIETIRQFDPESQRSEAPVKELRLLPAREFPMHKEAISSFRQRWRARFEGDPNRCPIYRDVSQCLAPAGVEYYLALFFDELQCLTDYLPDDALIIESGPLHDAAEAFWLQATERYEQYSHDVERPILAPTEVFQQVGNMHGALNARRRIVLEDFEIDEGLGNTHFAARTPTQLPIDARAEQPLGLVKRFISEFEGRVLFMAETAGRRETLMESFAAQDLRPSTVESWQEFLSSSEAVCITIAAVDAGTVLDDPALALISESQLFGTRAMQRRRRKGSGRDAESVIRDLTELQTGAPIVHEDHGVGRYLGLQILEVGAHPCEFLCIEYADGDKLYVPVASLHLVGRFTGADAEHAPLHRLGSAQWQKARSKAAERAHDVAAELLDVHARRAARPGIEFASDAHALASFEASFPFEETPDQKLAIEAVVDDMHSARAMDRLVCGDVGFGKTEVAMRAAFVAVNAGYQVAILVPTTLLAQQHHQNFMDRFADWGVRIEQLSRFRAKKERDVVVSALSTGNVDIVIGTHQLLQGDVKYKRLGLVVIDEEHRFGVRQKERFKALRAEIDVLTLTATPIPRTLNLALAGMRDLSIIATPPERRLSIKTFVREWHNALVREAILREIRRGGQVYFVHNKVETIDKVAREIAELVPDARVEVGHGQMRERDLERVMLDFYHRRFNVLVCTTIIETGIDVPTANTIIINRADRFGLAQLHQLRGRVGRSHHRAYAFLVVPPRKLMTSDAVKRLEAIESLEDLGIGFTLATHDLEIRGAGEILGEGQSGQIHEVGYAMYTRLLERAVKALRAGNSPQLDRPLDHGAEVDLRAPALIPDDYLPDVHMRLMMYKRIASAQDQGTLDELKVEMIDRFGLLPQAAKNLFEVTAVKLKASPLGVTKVDVGQSGGRVVFGPQANLDPAKVIRLVQGEPERYRLDGADKLRLSMDLPEIEDRVKAINVLLDALSTTKAA